MDGDLVELRNGDVGSPSGQILPDFHDVYRRVASSDFAHKQPGESRKADIVALASSSKVERFRFFEDERIFIFITPGISGIRSSLENCPVLLYEIGPEGCFFIQDFYGYKYEVKIERGQPVIEVFLRTTRSSEIVIPYEWDVGRFQRMPHSTNNGMVFEPSTGDVDDQLDAAFDDWQDLNQRIFPRLDDAEREKILSKLESRSDVCFARLFRDDRIFAIVYPIPGRGNTGNGPILLYQKTEAGWKYLRKFGGRTFFFHCDDRAPSFETVGRWSTELERMVIHRWNGVQFEPFLSRFVIPETEEEQNMSSLDRGYRTRYN